MEDEVDVDIEGDDFNCNAGEMDAAGLVQEQFAQPVDRSSSWMLPWELDSSISPENREAIERMLMEEQYYLTGERIPDILPSDPNKKPKVKKSPTKSSSSASVSISTRWSKQEKELFEKGLAQYGRRWTKIAKLVDTRSVLQVKSYARQYFKQKAKSDSGAAAPPKQQHQPPPSTMINTVRIERLSDDEDVDITDDLSDTDGEDMKSEISAAAKTPEAETQTERLTEQQKETTLLENIREMKDHPCLSSSSVQSPPPSVISCTEEEDKPTSNEDVLKTEHPGIEAEKDSADHSDDQSSQCETSMPAGQPSAASYDSTDSAENIIINRPEKDQEDEDEEVEELKAPEQETEMDTETITEDEKQAIPEFFEGRPSKTPERYLKIRNYILDQWRRSKPKYLNKTSVRPGLKNCGDVNCIGRIHTYLELIGAINFNCEQAVYNRPKLVDRSKSKEGKEVLEAYQLAQRLQSMRTRKRRVRDVWGNWCDARDLEGQTYEHLSAEELAVRREEIKKQPKPCKMSRHKGSIDPFMLIPCRSFEKDVQVSEHYSHCLIKPLQLNMHAHVSRGEVIGLLGGTFNKEEKILEICAAEPCNSVSTGLQCEMDPLSQTQACDVLSSLGFSVVGWYHSHPSFQPNPSVRDINTQDQFQSYFSRGGAPFIGMIVSPYDSANTSPHSQITCLLVKESKEPSGQNKLPYRFNFLSSQNPPDWKQTMRRAQWIIQKYAQSHGSVQMDRLFRRDSSLTCLEKMLSSLARHLEPLADGEGDHFLSEIQSLFLSEFISKQKSLFQGDGKPLDISKPVESDDDTLDHLVSQEKSHKAEEEAETNSGSVLHLGSVLTTEHDYLL
ncbi:PREDICTED: histone H2A deubiquitinase MYSM1 [Cyprinodon variegatus]|uniref:histone H2A deubiquitinase MYSM1 n=1 Tax=Cyprinodon variegatus TaxID=28743 RepID=UPI0007424FD0|nr:PREDICTED: histone H2A deubiquitinase MYSM1 [Cyprinodon variegatus]